MPALRLWLRIYGGSSRASRSWPGPSDARAGRALVPRNPAVAALAAGIVLLLVCGTAVSTTLAVWALNEKHHAAEHARRADENAVQARRSAKQEHAARELAEYRFTQAEKAVEQYLDGIENNEQLKEADFLELRKRLVASAIPFYEEFVQQRPGDKVETKRGRAYGRLGLIRKVMGEWEQAATDFEQMRAIFQRQETTDSSVRRELARSHFGLASALMVSAGIQRRKSITAGASISTGNCPPSLLTMQAIGSSWLCARETWDCCCITWASAEAMAELGRWPLPPIWPRPIPTAPGTERIWRVSTPF